MPPPQCEHSVPAFAPGAPWEDEGCRVCWLYVNSPDYREAWGDPGPPPRGRCRHLWPGVLESAACGCEGKHVRGCDLHDRCTLAPVSPAVQCCRTCPDHEEDAVLLPESLTAAADPAEVAALIDGGPVGPWPAGWIDFPAVRQAHRDLLAKAIGRTPPYPEGRFSGRGIVCCVSAKPGHSSGKDLANGYLPGAWVMVRELRRLGCTLPVTFAHLGPLEWDPLLTRLVAPLGVSVIDLRACEKCDPMRILAGWESKVYSIEQAPYEEVLYLDADNVPVRDPTYLFEAPRYLETGAVFWPDLPPHDRAEWLPARVWESVGMPYQNNVDFESGQLLIHKRTAWKPLRAARFINEHSDYWYAPGLCFGDKSTFHLAWARCGHNWGIPQRGAGWDRRAILQHDFAGELLFQHACRDKPTLGGYADRGYLAHEAHCNAHLAELRGLWNGRLWDNPDPGPEERAVRDRVLGRTWTYRRVGLGERPLRLVDDGAVGRGRARCEAGWAVVGDVLAISGIDGRPTCLLRECADGAWRGVWLEHERCEVELVPA